MLGIVFYKHTFLVLLVLSQLQQDEVTEEQTEQNVVVPSQENEVKEQSLSKEHKPSKSREGRRKDSHRSRSRSKVG